LSCLDKGSRAQESNIHCKKSRVILSELVNPATIGKHALYNARAVWIEVMLLLDWIHPMAFLLPK